MDPALSSSRPPPQRLIAIRMTSAPAGAVEQALATNLPGWEVEYREGQPRVPCGPDEQCVVIADGSKDASVPGDLSKPLSLITVAPGDGPNVAVRSISVSRGHQSAGGVARVELAGSGLGAAAKSEVRVLDGVAVIGSATREWSGASDADDRRAVVANRHRRARAAHRRAAVRRRANRYRQSRRYRRRCRDDALDGAGVRRASVVGQHLCAAGDRGRSTVRGRLPCAAGAGPLRRHSEWTSRRRGARPGVDGRDRRC